MFHFSGNIQTFPTFSHLVQKERELSEQWLIKGNCKPTLSLVFTKTIPQFIEELNWGG